MAFSLRPLVAIVTLVVITFVAIPSYAQTTSLAEDLATKDDRGFIVGLLENALGGEGRIVRVDGFSGALSKTATISQMTIADASGIWLTLEDVQLKWTRSALLRGRIDIQELSAVALRVARPPEQDQDALPDAEAGGFALPNLPVSVSIDALKIDRIELGRPILGEPAALTLNATAQLAAGSGSVNLTATRVDGAQGKFIIDASYNAVSQMAAIDIDLSEDPGGIAARMLNLPERPALQLKVSGEGNIDDLVTDISLKTNGVQRLDGEVVLKGSETDGRAFSLSLDGDLTSLLPQDYHSFFGPRSTLKAQGQQTPNGVLELSDLDLKTDALVLKGFAAFDGDFTPLRLALQGQVKPAIDGPVVLPIAGGTTRIDQADLKIGYDISISDIVDASFEVKNLDTNGLAIEDTQLNVTGALSDAIEASKRVQATFAFRASGATFDDPAQQEAFGDKINGSLFLDYEPGGAARLENIVIDGTQYGLSGDLLVTGLSKAFETEIDIRLRADRLSRFADLVGNELRGQAQLAIIGIADLGGAFNLNMSGTTTDLAIGIPQADNALAGETALSLNIVRDETGTQLPKLEIQNAQVQATASATLKANASNTKFDVLLMDSGQIDPRLTGPVTLIGRADQDASGWSLDTTLQGPFNATTSLKGRATGSNPSLAFNLKVPNIQPLARQFSGPLALAGTANATDGIWRITSDFDGTYGINGAVSGVVNGDSPNFQYRLRVPNVASLGAQIDGPLAIDGTAAQLGNAWRIDTNLSGLSGTQAKLSGQILSDGTLDLDMSGSAPLALANPFIAPRNIQGRTEFNLAVRGPAGLNSVSGTLSTTGARLSAPTLRISLADIAAQINLTRGRANIDATASVSSGGRVSVQGPIVLNGAMNADLALALNSVRVVDPALYETQLNGALTLRGPLGGGARIDGRIDVIEANIRVPESQVAGFTIIPSIVHRNASAGVKQTLNRAGLGQRSASPGAKSNTSFVLDILVNAPSRLFVRGRGLDAELGGTLRLSGRTDQIISTGRFSLIRGRFDVLGKRFVLSEGNVSLQGNFDPFLRFVATTRTANGTASIVIDGPASEPNVTFSATPEAPQDEVLAQIFFGRDVSQLSAFQALQLASAVASLAGKGGEGIISQLRRGFDLDDLDITTDNAGNTGLRLGKHISENVYTEVNVGNSNDAGVSINIDLSKSITARGQVNADGNSSIGIYFEKDY